MYEVSYLYCTRETPQCIIVAEQAVAEAVTTTRERPTETESLPPPESTETTEVRPWQYCYYKLLRYIYI